MTDQREPKPIDLVTELHEAAYGTVRARPESPKAVWEELLDLVRRMSEGRCGECMRRDSAPATLEAAVAERDALRDAIRNAPHELCCGQLRGVFYCKCWKAAALAGTQEDA